MKSALNSISIKEINRLAFPAILAGIAEPVIALIDTAFIGHIGTEALGGIGIGSSLFVLFVWVLTQTKTAISAIVSRHYGADTLDSVRPLIPQAIAFVFSLGVLVTLITRTFSTELLQLYSAEGEVLIQADKYFSIRCLGYPLVLSTYTLFGVFRGLQNTSWAMFISIGGALINTILDVLLIFGIEGSIPAMDIEGAAWASLIAQLCMLVATLMILLMKTPFGLRIRGKIHQEFRNMISLSSGFIIRTLALNLAFFLANRYATGYGAEYIAAHTIALNIWLFSSFFIDGYANAGNALAGRLLGRGDMKELERISKKLLTISIGIGAFLGLIYLALYPWMGGFFTDDDAVLGLFYSVYWIVIAAQPLNAVAFTFDGIFKGLGRAKLLMITLLIASFLGFIPTLIIGDQFQWGLSGIWAAFVIFMILRAGILLIEFRRKQSIRR